MEDPAGTINTKLHSRIEQGDQEDSDGGVLLVRRSRADAGNEEGVLVCRHGSMTAGNLV